MISGEQIQNKRLLLVSANTYANPYPVYPLGVSYLKTYLEGKTEGLDIRIFDFMNHKMEEYAHVLKSYKPDYTGISLRNIDDVNIYRQESFIAHYQKNCRRHKGVFKNPHHYRRIGIFHLSGPDV